MADITPNVEPTTGTLTNTKKIIVISSVGGVIVLSLIGIFVPDAREFIINASKGLLGAIPTLLK